MRWSQATGGSLSVGRLTARVEKRGRGERGERRSRHVSNQQSAIITPSPLSPLPSPLFTVRTPTRHRHRSRTEFGVEASATGITETHVFSGKVKIEGRGKAADVPERTLLAGQTVRLDAGKGVVDVVEPHRAVCSEDARLQGDARSRSDRPGRLQRHVDGQLADARRQLLAADDARVVAGGELPRQPAALVGFQQRIGDDHVALRQLARALARFPGARLQIGLHGNRLSAARAILDSSTGCATTSSCSSTPCKREDRINITIGDKPATIGGDRSLSVFFRAAGARYPEIGVFTPSKGEVDAGIRSGIPTTIQWHNYAVRFNLREKRLTVWVDRTAPRHDRSCQHHARNAGQGKGTWAESALDCPMCYRRRLVGQQRRPRVDRQLSRRYAAGAGRPRN